MYFKNIKKSDNQNEGPKQNTLKWGRILSGLTLALVVIGIITYGGFQVNNFYTRVNLTWDELQFAYEKPQIVKAMRVEYDNRKKALDEEFVKKEKTSEEKLIDQVVGSMQSEPKK